MWSWLLFVLTMTCLLFCDSWMRFLQIMPPHTWEHVSVIFHFSCKLVPSNLLKSLKYQSWCQDDEGIILSVCVSRYWHLLMVVRSNLKVRDKGKIIKGLFNWRNWKYWRMILTSSTYFYVYYSNMKNQISLS